MFGGGYSSVDSLVGFVSVEQPNFDITNFPSFTGGGQDAKAWFQVGSVTKGFNLSFTEPYFLDRPYWIGPDIYMFKREWDDYTEERIGGDIRFGRRWDDYSLGFTLKSENIKLSNVQVTGEEAGTKRKNALTTVFDYHKLDSMRVPTRGGRSTVSLEYAGGPFFGDLNFLKAIFEGHLYWPYRKTVLHSKTYLGIVEKMGSTTHIPIYERFFGGGIGTVRGYKERWLGPKDPVTGNPLGGDAIFAQNFEVLYPIYRDMLKGVVFFDIGNVWAGWSGLSDLKEGAGFGVRIVVPFVSAPIQVDYGFALNPDPGESRGRVHFGMSFGF
jgi:outer membrane protein insertion porin family